MITLDQMSNINVPLFLTIYQWILDNGGKPYVQFKISEKCQVPAAFLKDPQIVINLSPESIEDLNIDKEGVSFRARFNGLEQQLYFPFENISGISGGPNYQFAVPFPLFNFNFNKEEPPQTPQPDPQNPKPKRINHLSVVK